MIHLIKLHNSSPSVYLSCKHKLQQEKSSKHDILFIQKIKFAIFSRQRITRVCLELFPSIFYFTSKMPFQSKTQYESFPTSLLFLNQMHNKASNSHFRLAILPTTNIIHSLKRCMLGNRLKFGQGSALILIFEFFL